MILPARLIVYNLKGIPMRSTHRFRGTISLALVACFVATPALAAPNNADDAIYPRDLLKAKPAQAKQYRNVVKPVASEHAWIGKGGTQTPVTEVSFGGTDYAVLSSCKPHDCANENLVVLLPGSNTAQGEAVGALVANTGDNGLGPTQSTITWLGEPARDQRRFLGAYLFR